MAKQNNNEAMMKQMMQMLADMQARLDELESGKTSSKKKSATRKSKKELVEFKKNDGTVIMTTPGRAKAMAAYRDRQKNRMTLDEVKACTFNGKFTKAMDNWIIAHPTCSCKEFKAEFKAAKGCTKTQLHDHKAEMRAAKKMK